jgi:DNA (cytosine-5)-methyltransferase 1
MKKSAGPSVALSMSKLALRMGEGVNLALQERILDEVRVSGSDLSGALAARGLSYDDLRYQVSDELAWSGPRPLKLEEYTARPRSGRFVSFFTGCGGVDLGFEAAGLQHDASFEINELFCKTLRRNRPSWHVFGPPVHSGDVSNHEEIVEALSGVISTPYDGVFVGGPPCQPFSIAANQRFSKEGANFKRIGFGHERNGNLLFNFVSLVQEFRPAVFMIENVPGLRDIDGGAQLTAALGMLKAVGYRVEEPMTLNAADFGIPQNRYRLFVVGSRLSRSFRAPKMAREHIGCGSVLPTTKFKALNHDTREHKLESVLRYKRLYYGERDQLGRVDRLDPTLPSKTVIAGGVNGGGRSHLHPEIPRTLSVRECARLQTFPDDYAFIGPTARQFTQVGNAVPPLLAAQMGSALIKSYL